jgi:membrane-bound lytic murein transglycosylase D
VDPNIVAKAKADLATTKSDLPLVVNDYVAVFINFFANSAAGHNTLLHSFQRGGRYRAMIQRVMAEEGVPQDLIYLAVAESGFNPRASQSQVSAPAACGSSCPTISSMDWRAWPTWTSASIRKNPHAPTPAT